MTSIDRSRRFHDDEPRIPPIGARLPPPPHRDRLRDSERRGRGPLRRLWLRRAGTPLRPGRPRGSTGRSLRRKGQSPAPTVLDSGEAHPRTRQDQRARERERERERETFRPMNSRRSPVQFVWVPRRGPRRRRANRSSRSSDCGQTSAPVAASISVDTNGSEAAERAGPRTHST